MCHNITSLPGFYKTKKALQHGAYLPPAQVISAFSFFLFLLEFLLREQKATKDQFLRTAWYPTIKKFLPGFYQTNRFCDRVIRCLPSSKSSDLCCFFLPFSFRVSSTGTRSSIKRSISKTTLHAAIIKSLFTFVRIVKKLTINNREQARRNVNNMYCVIQRWTVTELKATLDTGYRTARKMLWKQRQKDNMLIRTTAKFIYWCNIVIFI